MGTETSRKIFRPGNPNVKTKPELLGEPSTRLGLHLPTITQTKLTSSFAPKHVHERLMDAAVKPISVLSLACCWMSFKDLGKMRSYTFPSKGRMPALTKHPGGAGCLLLLLLAGQQWWYPVWDAAALPNHRNRRRQLLTAVKHDQDRSGDALASSLFHS